VRIVKGWGWIATLEKMAEGLWPWVFGLGPWVFGRGSLGLWFIHSCEPERYREAVPTQSPGLPRLGGYPGKKLN